MRRIGKATSVGLVWLGAAMTLLGGAPGSSCRCADGRTKTFCLGIAVAGSRRCCCGGSCCSGAGAGPCSVPQGERATRPCCGQTHASVSPPAGVAVGGPCCVRTGSRHESVVSTPAVAGDEGDPLGRGLLLAPSPNQQTFRADSSEFPAWGVTHSLSPPPDLLALLQRLLV